MKTRFIKAWESVRASYWFVPMLMAILAIALSFATTAVDSIVGADWIDQIDWLYANKPDGARALLSTIAGSMIGVAGVTFSITIAAVSYATGQFGPRLLTNFMRDRGNQLTLGTFIATFLYCLLVLRTIRSPDEAATGSEVANAAAGFVPHLAILVALIFALASIGVLIYFIHHIPESIHASNVVAGVGRELEVVLEDLFPEGIGYDRPADEGEEYDPETDVPEDFLEKAVTVEADGAGYVQYIDQELLLEAATEYDLLLRLEYRPGDFVIRGRALVQAWPPDHIDDQSAQRLRRAFAWGRQRTQRQDLGFLLRELVEIASRALSPGTNDPFTAMTCMDWLGSTFSDMARCSMPSAYRYDADRNLRVIVTPDSFERFCEEVFPPLRPYAQADRNAALHLMEAIAEVGCAAESEHQRQVLLRHATDLRDGARASLSHAYDLDALEERYRVTAHLLRDGKDAARAAVDKHQWLGGSG